MNKLYELLENFCEVLLTYTEADQSEWGGIRCPACRKVHGRSGEALFPFHLMYARTRDQRYLDAAANMLRFVQSTQLADGSWLNEVESNWRGTTVFQLLSLCHTYDLLIQHKRMEESKPILHMIETSAKWVSDTFGNGGQTNVNYFITAALCLYRSYLILGNKRYQQQAEALMQKYGLGQINRDGFLLGEKTGKRPHFRMSGQVDIGYNLDMSLGAMAEYALLVKDETIKTEVVRALTSHMDMMFPDGSIDNSFGSRNNKWTLYGSKTAHGSQIAFMLLSEENSAFYDAAMRNTAYLQRVAQQGNGLLGYGPHYDQVYDRGCVHSTINRADALAIGLAYGQIPKAANASIPSVETFGAKSYPSLQIHHLRQADWMATISCNVNTNVPTGGAVSYLWNKQCGPVQLGSMTKYTRYEEINMPAAPLAHENDNVTPEIQACYQQKRYSNLYEQDAHAVILDKEKSIANVSGKLKRAEENNVYDCGIHYDIIYSMNEGVFVKKYTFDVQQWCESITVTEPIICGRKGTFSKDGNEVTIQAEEGHIINVEASEGAFEFVEPKGDQKWIAVFPTVITMPLRWELTEVAAGSYEFTLKIKVRV